MEKYAQKLRREICSLSTEARYGCMLQLACIDKWVKSKFEVVTPPELCSGPKLAIWYKNQPPRPEKTPGLGEKSKMATLPLFGHARVLGEKAIVEYNNSY